MNNEKATNHDYGNYDNNAFMGDSSKFVKYFKYSIIFFNMKVAEIYQLY